MAAKVEARLVAASDSSYRERMQGMVPTADGILGVPVPQIRALAAEFAKAEGSFTLADACLLLSHFGERRSREGMLFSTFLLIRFRRYFSVHLWLAVDRWVDMVDNWETCDQMATNIASEIVARNLHLVDTLVQWTASPNLWRRRFAVAATTALNQRGRRYPAESLRVCEHLMGEKESIVQKAVGWAIREASEQDPDAAFQFLSRWKGKAQPRILREGAQKLPAEYRAALLG